MNETARQLLARIETIDASAADNRLRAEAYQRVAGELKNASGKATSPDGVVTVVAGPGGVISSVIFSERARETDPSVLSADVMQAISEAQSTVAWAQADVVRRGLGDTELLDRVLDSDERLFGASRPESVLPPAPEPERSEPDVVDEEYFEEFDLFDDDEPAR
ncbi:YbaB/EbfC family nucleoid-associated protein [Amycolatopsis jiangsuensis]|uniref:DNA-binding protein YbaB n=1 Tax=Amycolatopsis jiangsuensis TaxID=1181879 RepID=A0A840ITZ3_9PSEU|nr:YbaB/EbfC family nucleoid-associated protein [Amycolatopsis jiangsuensis]MBB4685340.1 DNA-binding protein YbaB [Amycolatopsis jiangsuensis]